MWNQEILSLMMNLIQTSPKYLFIIFFLVVVILMIKNKGMGYFVSFFFSFPIIPSSFFILFLKTKKKCA